MVWGGQIGGVEALGARLAFRLSVYTPEDCPRLKSKIFAVFYAAVVVVKKSSKEKIK